MDERISIPITVSPRSGGGAEPAYGRFSIPLPRGSRASAADVTLQKGTGEFIPSQVSLLAHWPDGGARMLQVIAPMEGGNYRVEIGNPGPVAKLENAIQTEVQEDGSIIVRNGGDTVCFAPGGLLSQVVRDGVELLDEGGLQIRSEWMSANGEVTAFSARAEAEGPGSFRQRGPLHTMVERWARAVVAIGGASRYLRFRLQFEFFAGVSGMVVNAMLIHDCPGAEVQEIRSIELIWALRESRHALFQKNYGFEYLSGRFVETSQPVQIRLDQRFQPYVANFEVLEDANVYPPYLRPPPAEVQSAVFLGRDDVVLQMEMEDFHLLRPKGIRLEGGSAVFELWPDWAGTLRLPQGRRRQVRIAVHWGQRALLGEWREAQAASAALLEIDRCQLPTQAYANAGFFDQRRILHYQPDRYPRIEGWLSAMSKLRTVAQFFDLGDTPDSHYITTYIPVGYSKRRSNLQDDPPRLFIDSGRMAQCFEKLQDHEPIWTNNEYDAIFCLGTEFLRSANLLLGRQLRWFARHTIEVDFVFYSDYSGVHRAQPAHSEHHTSTGAYPSHFWTQGLAQYYFLSGDEDAFEVIRALADKTIWYFDHPVLGGLHSGANREMGWAVLTLVSAYEATGDSKFDTYARRMIDTVLSEPLPSDLPNFNFGHTSLLLGCRAYLQAHEGDPETQSILEWYLKVVDLAICSSRSAPGEATKIELKLSYDYELSERGSAHRSQPRPGILSGFAAPDCLAYAYERTGDRSYLRAGLKTLAAFLDGNPGYFGGAVSFSKTVPEAKAFAMAYRTWIGFFGALDAAGWLEKYDYQEPDL